MAAILSRLNVLKNVFPKYVTTWHAPHGNPSCPSNRASLNKRPLNNTPIFENNPMQDKLIAVVNYNSTENVIFHFTFSMLWLRWIWSLHEWAFLANFKIIAVMKLSSGA